AVDHAGDGIGLRYVRRNRNGAMAGLAEIGDQRVRSVCALAIVHRDRGAGLRERHGDCRADAARGPGYQRDLVLQIRRDDHDVLPYYPPSSAASRSASAMSSTVLALKKG